MVTLTQAPIKIAHSWRGFFGALSMVPESNPMLTQNELAKQEPKALMRDDITSITFLLSLDIHSPGIPALLYKTSSLLMKISKLLLASSTLSRQ